MGNLTDLLHTFLGGFGFGSGGGSGFGGGFGSGGGSGSGGGFGSGITHINGYPVAVIDGVLTAISKIRGNVAKGWIVNRNLTFSPCYVVKSEDLFAHGETLHEAMDALWDKLFDDMAEEERIQAFVEAHQSNVPYPNQDLFQWHHRLTGSCLAGRKDFVARMEIDMDGATTPEEFIRLTEHAYGGGVIQKLKRFYPC